MNYQAQIPVSKPDVLARVTDKLHKNKIPYSMDIEAVSLMIYPLNWDGELNFEKGEIKTFDAYIIKQESITQEPIKVKRVITRKSKPLDTVSELQADGRYLWTHPSGKTAYYSHPYDDKRQEKINREAKKHTDDNKFMYSRAGEIISISRYLKGDLCN